MSGSTVMTDARAERIRRLAYPYAAQPLRDVPRCNLCDGRDSVPLTSRDRYGFPAPTRACRRCGLAWLSPQMTPETQAAFYASVYRPLVSAYHGRCIDARTIQAEQRDYAGAIVGAAGAWLEGVRGGRLLDVGGSTGVVAGVLAQTFDLRATVLDPSPDEIREARAAGLDTLLARVEDWEPEGARFDAIGLFQTIDHLLDVRGTLTRLRRALGESGVLLVDIVDVRHVMRAQGSFEAATKIDHPFSLTTFTAPALLARAGFRAEHAVRSADGHLVLYICRPGEPDPDALPPATEVAAFLAEAGRR